MKNKKSGLIKKGVFYVMGVGIPTTTLVSLITGNPVIVWGVLGVMILLIGTIFLIVMVAIISKRVRGNIMTYLEAFFNYQISCKTIEANVQIKTTRK